MGRSARALAAAAAFLFASLALAPAWADLKIRPRPRMEPPMRIMVVTASDPACGRDCPQWISAEGRITPGIERELARVVDDLHGRRLPILLSSRGGSVRDAIAMGVLIRQKRLAVGVARTLIAACPPQGDCPPRGEAMTGGAVCASACPLILAGGVERLAGPVALVGVHQITTVVKAVEGSEHLTSIRKLYEETGADEEVQRYLTAMGVGDPVMTLLRRTPPSGIRWLSPAELRASSLITQGLDAGAPIQIAGANGLNGRTPEGAPAGLIKASAIGGAAAVAVSLTYRRGGGALELVLSSAGGRPPPVGGWTVRMTGVEPIAAAPDSPVLLSRAALCPAHGFSATPVAAVGLRPAAFVLSAGNPLFDEMCP